MSTSSGERMLRLLSLLQKHRYWPGAELAERLDVSLRTLRRDVDRLRELGYPVNASRGVTGGYQLQAGASLPPLLLEDSEAVAIAVSLRTAASGVVSGIEEPSIQALGKLVQVMPARLRRQVDALQEFTVPVMMAGPVVDAFALSALAQACRDDERLTFDYTKRGGDPEPRHVEPHRLVAMGRRWYLVAFDLDRGDWRSFRVDRLVDPKTNGARFRQRELPANDAAAFVQAGIESARTHFDVSATVFLPADVVRERGGRWATVTEIDDESCRIEMRVDTFDWPAMFLGSMGAKFEVIGPSEFKTVLRDWSERFAQA